MNAVLTSARIGSPHVPHTCTDMRYLFVLNIISEYSHGICRPLQNANVSVILAHMRTPFEQPDVNSLHTDSALMNTAYERFTRNRVDNSKYSSDVGVLSCAYFAFLG
jgi:hypothetical protein